MLGDPVPVCPAQALAPESGVGCGGPVMTGLTRFVRTMCCDAPVHARTHLMGDLVLLTCAACQRDVGSPGAEDSEDVEALLMNAPAIDYPELISLSGDWPEISHGRVSM
jgi:hypothetical protein